MHQTYTLDPIPSTLETMRILTVEDDNDLSEALATTLQEEGFAVDVANDGQEGNFLCQNEAYDLVILDWRLPLMDGITILRNFRQKNTKTPVLILTGKNAEEDKVEGLNAGADDYLTKPFSIKELKARVLALIRRSHKEPELILKVADLELDPRTHEVKRGSRVLSLSPKEFAILEYLMSHKDEVVTRTTLLEHVWDYNFDGISNVVDVFMSYLRKKVDNGQKQKLIQTIHGVGFKISATEAA